MFAAAEVYQILSPVYERIANWNPRIDPAKIKTLSCQYLIWNDGSLGCPMPGCCYTQALVPGFLIIIEHENVIYEVHTDIAMTSIAIPNIGFI